MACPPEFSQGARALTAEELERLKKDTELVSPYKQAKLEKEAEKNWDLFYKRNTTKFFKDRHWTTREFEELIEDDKGDSGGCRVVLEVGCGVGNFLFPLLEEDHSRSLFFYACDFSKRAVQFVKDHPSYDSSRCSAFHADVTVGLTSTVPADSVDIATMIFVLSAVHPDKMLQALANIAQVLKPRGMLLFRDYGLYDYAMLRFAPGHKLSENLYVRQDGTRAYYFSLEILQNLAERAGLTVNSIHYVHRQTVNKKQDLCVPRIFVQAKFTKPSGDSQTSSKQIVTEDIDSDKVADETESGRIKEDNNSKKIKQKTDSDTAGVSEGLCIDIEGLHFSPATNSGQDCENVFHSEKISCENAMPTNATNSMEPRMYEK